MSEDKVKAILDWPVPRKVKDIQSFLGFTNFYCRFIHEYSDIVIPLTHLTCKGTPWKFDDKCMAAFNELKQAFTHAPILTHWVPDRQLVVETDASDYAIAAILSIYLEDREIHPIAFLSRSLHNAELNYDTHDKELLAIFEAFKYWHHYLEGFADPINIVTDHKNLEYFSTTKILTRRQVRWSKYLSQFNLVIRFRPGKLGGKPDALTRRWDVYPKEGDSQYAAVNPHNFRPVFTQEQLSASLRATFLEGPTLRASAIMNIDKLHLDIKQAQLSDSVASDGFCQAKSSTPISSSQWSVDESDILRLDNCIYVPDSEDLRLRVLQNNHNHILAGHFGQNWTLELVRQSYTWPQMHEYVCHYVKSCMVCGRNKTPRHRPYGLLKPLLVLEHPWDSISMDFIEQLPDSNGFTAILVVIDRTSKQAIFIPTHDTINSEELARLFVIHVFSKHGVPNHITSDCGSEFVSQFMRTLAKALDMELHFTSGYHPEADGQTERANQTLEQYICIYCSYQQDNWDLLLPIAEFAYNNAPNASTRISPFFANKGYHPNITVHLERDIASARARDFVVNLDELHQFLCDEITQAQSRYKIQADKHRNPAPPFKVGDKVFLSSKHIKTTRPTAKFTEKFLGPFEIIAQPGSHSFTLKLPSDLHAIHPVFHISQLEPVEENTIPNRTQPPLPLVEVDGEEQYEIAQILDSKIDRRFRCLLLYRIQWLGYKGTDKEFAWLPATEFSADDFIEDFHHHYPDKPGPLAKVTIRKSTI